MFLPDIVIPGLINQSFLTNVIDSPERCLNKKHYASYPWDIAYNYNTRGFRDLEWPDSLKELKNSVWCVGDSFTVGIGSPFAHTWPQVLQQATQQRVINVSMTGASNNWISRKACGILNEIQPALMVIHWSYDHRRELEYTIVKDKINQHWKKFYSRCAAPAWPEPLDIDQFDSLPREIQEELKSLHGFDFYKSQWDAEVPADDEQRRIWQVNSTDNENNHNMIECVRQVELCKKNCTVVHSLIPQYTNNNNASTSWNMLAPYGFIPEFDIIDLSRDGKHYDIKTSQFFVQQIIQFCKAKYSINLV
jgi:hypothetical protein